MCCKYVSLCLLVVNLRHSLVYRARRESVIWNMQLTRGVILVYPTSQTVTTKVIRRLYE